MSTVVFFSAFHFICIILPKLSLTFRKKYFGLQIKVTFICNGEEMCCEAEYPLWTVITCLMLAEKHFSNSSGKQIISALL